VGKFRRPERLDECDTTLAATPTGDNLARCGGGGGGDCSSEFGGSVERVSTRLPEMFGRRTRAHQARPSMMSFLVPFQRSEVFLYRYELLSFRDVLAVMCPSTMS